MFEANNSVLDGHEDLTAVLIGIITQKQSQEEALEYLDELAFLANTANVKALKYFTQKMEAPHSKTFVGKGKLEEIVEYVNASGADLLIFDDELTGAQINNIEKITNCKILDRSDLILYIFQKRAQTATAKLQVELAQMQYVLPRLKRMWTHLERQRGGTGTRGGSGEKEIETDRRIIRKRIADLTKKLADIDKQGLTQRKRRSEFIRVSLVGYTNVGKTTTMNLLTKQELFAENKLFATVDTTVRKMTLNNVPFLISDTVGFIRKLPHHLVESFKTTLDEVKEADVMLHVVDFAHPNFENHMEVVNQTLGELGAKPKKNVVVFNKIDAFREKQINDNDPFFSDEDMEDIKQSWKDRLPDCEVVFMSAIKRENVEELREVVTQAVRELYLKRYPYKADYL